MRRHAVDGGLDLFLVHRSVAPVVWFARPPLDYLDLDTLPTTRTLDRFRSYDRRGTITNYWTYLVHALQRVTRTLRPRENIGQQPIASDVQEVRQHARITCRFNVSEIQI